MTKFGWCLVLLASLCCGTAQAAEFLLLDVDADSDLPTIMMADSSTVMDGETGHKLATLLSIHEASEWDERKMELDCASQRWRELGGVQHNMDGSVFAEPPDDDWASLENGSVGLRVRDTICAWPGKRPDADEILTGDLQDLINRASALVSKMAADNQKKRDGDN